MARSGLDSVDQAAKLAFLSRPSSYPEGATAVDVKETHMSWVFLTGPTAYKLKKPVRHDFLDFSTVQLRRRFCDEELRLNRRLAPDVYLAIVPLTMMPNGMLQLGGDGVPVDWLVKMRQLPVDRMLDSAIRARQVLPADLDALSALLAGFYRSAAPVAVTIEDYCGRIRAGIDGNRLGLAQYCPPSEAPLIERVAEAQARFLAGHAAAFAQRVREGCIVEGHGDLRPEHVFLGPPPQIIDCLEFEYAFRIVDIADDLASLAMECDQLHAPEVGDALFRIEAARRAPADLIAFYKSYRATLRAKLAIWHLKDAGVADPSIWERRARSYLDLADRERNGLF